ncbi:MAG: transcriptional repressor [Sedimentisphaerales bacterium]|jgi:Fe2+ or Zn2+ uptake regulation protein|nr:transcriptional repressor [Sedimentisphaerales bacterium]
MDLVNRPRDPVDTNTRTEALNLLKAKGLYKTRARVAVIGVLLQSDSPMSQDQIAQRLRHRYDRVTIYRTLASLRSAGLVHRAFTGNRTWQFELSRNCWEDQCHPHLTCSRCGKTHCLVGLEPPIACRSYNGFVIHRQQVHFEGICPQCSPCAHTDGH